MPGAGAEPPLPLGSLFDFMNFWGGTVGSGPLYSGKARGGGGGGGGAEEPDAEEAEGASCVSPRFPKTEKGGVCAALAM